MSACGCRRCGGSRTLLLPTPAKVDAVRSPSPCEEGGRVSSTTGSVLDSSVTMAGRARSLCGHTRPVLHHLLGLT